MTTHSLRLPVLSVCAFSVMVSPVIAALQRAFLLLPKPPGSAACENGGVGAMDRRRELGEFLRSRRERRRPEDVGLPVSGRRRTPGLRREEVATLAGMSVT